MTRPSLGNKQSSKESTDKGRQLGKVDTLLNEKLKTVEWGEFKVKSLFEVVGTKSLDRNAMTFVEQGINFVGRTFDNNGIQGKIEKQNFAPNEPFTITVTVIGNYKYVKFQKEPYYCSQNINKLTPKKIITKWNENIAYYFITYIQKFVSLYDNQQGGYKLNDIKNHTIKIPLFSNGTIDFDFMESFVAELEAARIKEVDKYLKDNGLSNYHLTEKEKQALEDFEGLEWGEFRVGQIFEIGTGSLLPSGDLLKGDIPRISAKSDGNGILSYFNTEKNLSARHCENFITVNFFGADGGVFYHPYRSGKLKH